MKSWKWRRSVLLFAAFGFCFSAGAYAQETIARVDAYLRPDFHIIVNGKPVNLQNATLIYNDNSYLPLKELASLLEANVNWKGETQTIYVNSRINPEQPETSGNLNYDSIIMINPVGLYVDYLGGTYELLKLYGTNDTYYRESDLRAMGVDTSGLKKAEEAYTKWLFVSETELRKRWKQEPQPNYNTEYSAAVTTEKDPLKLKALNDYIKTWQNYQVDGHWRYYTPIVVDKMPEENQYRYLVSESGHFYFMYLKLTKYETNTEISYLVSASSTEDIQAGFPDPYTYR